MAAADPEDGFPPIFVSSRARRLAVLLMGALLAVALAGMILFDHSIGTLTDPELIRETVAGFGIFAPVAFVALQVLQVLFAPIPGQVLAMAGGYVFGPVNGLLYSLVGATIGSAIAFALSRRYGRPTVERLIHPRTLATVDAFLEAHGRLAVFLVFLVPGLPDDALCFVCGLTPIPLRSLVVLSFVGRIPGYALLSLAGGRFATHRPLEAALILAVVALAAIVGYLARDRLLAFSGS